MLFAPDPFPQHLPSSCVTISTFPFADSHSFCRAFLLFLRSTPETGLVSWSDFLHPFVPVPLYLALVWVTPPVSASFWSQCFYTIFPLSFFVKICLRDFSYTKNRRASTYLCAYLSRPSPLLIPRPTSGNVSFSFTATASALDWNLFTPL